MNLLNVNQVSSSVQTER